MPLVPCYTPWKHHENYCFLMFKGGIERDQCYEMTLREMCQNTGPKIFVFIRIPRVIRRNTESYSNRIFGPYLHVFGLQEYGFDIFSAYTYLETEKYGLHYLRKTVIRSNTIIVLWDTFFCMRKNPDFAFRIRKKYGVIQGLFFYEFIL